MGQVPGIPSTNNWVTSADKLDPNVQRWMDGMRQSVNASPQQVGTVVETGSVASIPATTIPIQQVNGTSYQVSYTLQVVTPASVSSSITFTLSWTNPYGVVCSQSGVALTGNATATQQNGVFSIDVTASTDISYAVAYASVGTAMAYAVTVRAVEMPL